jgi:hypothetical protein
MTDYSKLKVAELKELVKERGIAAPGLKLKQQFIDALAAADVEGNNEKPVEEVKEAEAEETEGVEAEKTRDVEAEEVEHVDGNGMDVDEKVEEKEEIKPAETMANAEADEDSNKRKRRSPTPPLREESVSKKLKTAPVEEVPVLAEDIVEVPQQVEPIGDKDKNEHVEAEVEEKNDKMEDKDEEMKDASTFMSDTTSTAPALHSATRALYIQNLVRPLQPQVLRDHLVAIASPPSSPNNASIVEEFHLDKLRSHALVLFSSISAASRARSAIHDQVWPAEPMRKPLFADFIPDDTFQEWVDLEISRERENLRWEVVYNPAEDGKMTASLQEASATRQPSNAHQAPPTGHRAEGMPNAPTGPRPQAPAHTAPPVAEPVMSKSFTQLDASYKFTETKPKLYWQPVNPDLAARRLEELERETSRDWDGNMGTADMRRYTFEDGDGIVDGGVDWGKFGGGGHHAGPPPRRGGGRDFGGRGRRGGGGGGGYRGGGGGGGYRGDSYRGGGARW